MDVNMNKQQHCLSWDNLPSEIYFLLFDYMPPSSLVVCMFVNETWRDHVEHVLQVKRKWGRIFNVPEFILKCHVRFDVRKMYYNYILWHNIEKATVKLHNLLQLDGIKKANIYRDNLIVVTNETVQHYEVKTLNIRSTMKWPLCRDFQENDAMAVKVIKHGKYVKLEVLAKLEPKPIYVTKYEVYTVNHVICYKIHRNECHVIDHRNTHYMYRVNNGQLKADFFARYYGNPDESCAINIFGKRCYLMLTSGAVILMDSKCGQFIKTTRIASKSQGKTQMVNHKMFLWFCVPVYEESPQTQETEPIERTLSIERYAPWSDPNKHYDPYIGIVRNVSCMLLHSDIMYLGHSDGTVQMMSLRDLSRSILKLEPLRQFNVRDFNKDILDVAVLSIDVFEEEHLQHMFVATNTHVLHLHVTHPHKDEYMWSDEAYKGIMLMPE